MPTGINGHMTYIGRVRSDHNLWVAVGVRNHQLIISVLVIHNSANSMVQEPTVVQEVIQESKAGTHPPGKPLISDVV